MNECQQPNFDSIDYLQLLLFTILATQSLKVYRSYREMSLLRNDMDHMS